MRHTNAASADPRMECRDVAAHAFWAHPRLPFLAHSPCSEHAFRRIAAAGKSDARLVEDFARHPYFARPAPKLRVPVEPAEAVGWNGDFLEAQCFSYLAVRSLLILPLSLPTTTGLPQPMTGGELAPRA